MRGIIEPAGRKSKTLSKDAQRTRFLWLRIVILGCVLLTLLVSAAIASGQQASAARVKAAPVKAGSVWVVSKLVPGSVHGVALNALSTPAGIPWVKIAYPTCGAGNLNGSALQKAIQSYHNKGIHVLLIYCQPQPKQLYDTSLLRDAAQARADAVQCGNEQMKSGKYNNYVTPASFARFFDLCQGAMHAVNPAISIVLGALDPHVAGYDYKLMMGQVAYLNQMQTAMNTQVNRHGNWQWRSQIVGIINSWHDGYPSLSVNNLLGLFTFWANQFHVNLNSGALGQHMWVVEDTGCFRGCDNNINTNARIAIAHIMALIVDTQTTMRYRVPYFFFSDRDFISQKIYWPIGLETVTGQSKAIRQDLRMGSRAVTLSCARGRITVVDQVKLLASLYNGCSLQGNWYKALI